MWITTEFVDFLRPTIRAGLYVLRVVWQSPHLCKLLKTNARYADKGEVGGSSPPRPTISKKLPEMKCSYGGSVICGFAIIHSEGQRWDRRAWRGELARNRLRATPLRVE